MAAARNFLSVKYVRLPELLVELSIARNNGTFPKVIQQFKKPALLIIDEWLLYPLKETEARDLLEISEARYKKASTIFCSQFDMVLGKTVPYFRDKKIRLKELTALDIQNFYTKLLKTVSANTVIHIHANIHKALKYAVKMDMIPVNPADKVERPKKERYVAEYYNAEELEKLFEAIKGNKYERCRRSDNASGAGYHQDQSFNENASSCGGIP